MSGAAVLLPTLLARLRTESARRWRRGLTLPLLLLFGWWAVYRFGLTDTRLFVPPGKVLDTAGRLLDGGRLFQILGQSLLRDLAGFSIGSLAGLLTGVLLGVSPLAGRLVGPTLHGFKQISLFAWLPLLSIWFGYGEASMIVFISLATFFPVVLNTLEGVGSVPRELIELARVLRMTRMQAFRLLILPSALPSIFNGVYLALIFSWLATLGAEYMLGTGSGVGALLAEGRENFEMDLVLLGIVLVGTIGFAFDTGARRLEKRLLKWRRSSALASE